ncbi:MAG: hypothetical protein HXY21_07380, partial [Parvularculaceae bacterium]|nr:hypothetical protein [Parvularculaceae bacterium]
MPAADNDFLESKTAIRFLDGKNANNALVTYYTDRHFSATEGKALIDEQYEAACLQLIQNFYTPDATATTADVFVIVDATNRSGDVAIEHFGVDKADQKNLVLAEELNDSVDGGGEADALYGGAGDDLLAGDGAGLSASTAGDDVLHGGAGVDSVDYSLEDGTANQTFEAGDIAIGAPTANNEPTLLVTDTYGKTDTLISIEMLIAPGGGDAIDLDGFTGSIGIDGGGGDDTLTGGDGSDSLFGGEGFDSVTGGAGNDLLGNIHTPSFDYSALTVAERNAIADTEFSANNAAVNLIGGAGADLYLIDFAPDALNLGVQIIDPDQGSKIFVRNIKTGAIDALSAGLVAIPWMRPALTVNAYSDGFFLNSVDVPSDVQLHFGLLGESGAFYYLGPGDSRNFLIEDRGGEAVLVVQPGGPGDSFSFSDPDFASSVVWFASVEAFLDTAPPAQQGPIDKDVTGGSAGIGAQGPGNTGESALTIQLGSSISPGGSVVFGAAFGGIGNAQLSDLGLADPSPGSGPPPSA